MTIAGQYQWRDYRISFTGDRFVLSSHHGEIASGFIDHPGRGAAPLAVFDKSPAEDLPWLPTLITDKWVELQQQIEATCSEACIFCGGACYPSCLNRE